MMRDDYAVPSAQTLVDSRLDGYARQLADAHAWVRQQQAINDTRLIALAALPVLSGNSFVNRVYSKKDKRDE